MKFIKRDENLFNPEKQTTFSHNLCEHPLFQLEELKKLACRHPTVRFHSALIPRDQRLDRAVQDCPNGMTLPETLDNIEKSGSFVFIMDVQNDPLYAPLMNQILDEIESTVGKHHHNMRKRQAWIFITSPGGTTPYHRDHEASHYFHIKGKKTLWLWDQNDPEVVTQEENEIFHGTHSLKKTLYREALMEKGTEHKLTPGQGVFFPYTAPHMVENGTDEFSISFSVTHMTDETYNIKRLHKMNQLIRKAGILPSPHGRSRVSDTTKLLLHNILRNTVYSNSREWIDT